MDSDSSYYTTTFSEDERIEKYLELKRAKEKQEIEHIEKLRSEEYQAYFQEYKNDETSIFNLLGLDIVDFDHTKVRFWFIPHQVVNLTSKRIKFFCSLRFHIKYWRIKRSKLPTIIKLDVHRMFYNDEGFCVCTISELGDVLKQIYDLLVDWSEHDKFYRCNKMKRYNEGEDVHLFSTDEELFLSPEEIQFRHEEKDKILQRMIPPDAKEVVRKRRKRNRSPEPDTS